MLLEVEVEEGLLVDGETDAVKALAHITGGGFIENIPRVLPKATVAEIDLDAVPYTPVFDWLQKAGGLSDHELRRTFNCGVGLLLIVDPHHLPDVLEGLVRDGEDAFVCGELAEA